MDVDGSAVLSGFEIRAAEANGYPDLPSWGGGLILKDAHLTVEDCRFADNTAINAAAILKEYDNAVPIIRGCTFEGNRTFGGSIVDSGWPGEAGVVIRDCVFRENFGTGLDAVSPSPIENVAFIENTGRGLISREPLTIKDCSFVRNGLGGMYAGRSAYVIGCEFIGNTSVSTGAGILAGLQLSVINSVFVGNTGYGSTISGGMGSTNIVNTTIIGNSTGGVAFNGTGHVKNSIVWGNGGGLGELAQVSWFQVPPTVDYSIIQGWTGALGGIGNSGDDPLFMDADGADDIPGTEDDDLRLMPGSPAINGGDPDETYLPPVDLDQHARVLCGRVDIGAYESGIGDYNCDEGVDLTDFANWESCMSGPAVQSTIDNRQSRMSPSAAVPYPLNPKPQTLDPACRAFDFNADGDVDLADFQGKAPARNLFSIVRPARYLAEGLGARVSGLGFSLQGVGGCGKFKSAIGNRQLAMFCATP